MIPAITRCPPFMERVSLLIYPVRVAFKNMAGPRVGREEGTMNKYVYFFGGRNAEGRSALKDLLGGKGANLAEMVNLGIPRPRRDSP